MLRNFGAAHMDRSTLSSMVVALSLLGTVIASVPCRSSFEPNDKAAQNRPHLLIRDLKANTYRIEFPKHHRASAYAYLVYRAPSSLIRVISIWPQTSAGGASV